MYYKSLIFVLLCYPLFVLAFVPISSIQSCISSPLKNAEKQFFISMINDVRELVTLGQLPGFPSSSDMALVLWDKDMERIAQEEANTCQMSVRTCPNSKQAPYGFMIGTYKSRCPYAVQSVYALSAIANSWYEEHKYLDPRNVCNLKSCAAPNFTQMITGIGYLLGCGRVIDFDGQFYSMNLICVMQGAGNRLGEAIYQVGSPCTQCKPGCKCDDKDHPALCHGWVGWTVGVRFDAEAEATENVRFPTIFT